MIKISVIVPTHNSANFLSDCLESLLSQTLNDFEVIVVDDASVDNTEEVVNRYTNSFLSRLKYIKLEKKVGRGEVRNHGIKQAIGKYITFLDSDDVYFPDKLEVQSKYIDEHPMVGGVSCQYYYCNSRLEQQELSTGANSYFAKLFGSQYTNFEVVTASIMIRREVLDEVGLFDSRIVRGQDLDLVIRIARRYRIDFLPVPLYMYRIHGNNSGSYNALMERTVSNLIICRKIIDSEPFSKKAKVNKFVFDYLSAHIYRIRERSHLISIKVWFMYLWKMKYDLPLLAWCMVGVKTLVGYRFTKAIKKITGFS